MQPHEFVAKWQNISFGEKQASQEMFLDICALVDHPTPVAIGNPDVFTFEKWVPGGFADAYLEGHFGWEFKGDDSELDSALNQLLRYQVHLKTPPLLIVSSFRTIRIQTNFPGMATEQHIIPVTALDRDEHLAKLRWAFHAPAEFRPDRTLEDATKETADVFHAIVQDMEKHDVDPERLARYLNQIVFCLYAEDADLLPEGLFSRIVRQYNHDAKTFDQAVRDLFDRMSSGGLYGSDKISHFNGDLFNTVDTVLLSEVALYHLDQAAQKDWRNIEPSIFGTLFERALDASKRSQLGAHYTGAADIDLVVQPVVMDPLRREWDTARQEVDNLISEENWDQARVRLEEFQQRLFEVTVLDPACGSGNFLYIALRSLLDLEKEMITFAATRGWHDLKPRVKPDQMMGLEINPYAAELARTALWIGYIQWHHTNGFSYDEEPILTPLNTIQQTDAILDLSDPDGPAEPEWPNAEFIIGNPPFLGSIQIRRELMDLYAEGLYGIYGSRIPNASDFCCYWFEKARAQIETGKSLRAGLLGTQAIRFQNNRQVLARIKETGDIFAAISDRDWVLEGANVHISVVCFDKGAEAIRTLDGKPVGKINVDLTAGPDMVLARRLRENANICYLGEKKHGPFEIDEYVAREMLQRSNPHGKPNSDVVKPWLIGRDINQKSSERWIVDFGVSMPVEDAALYEVPFEYIKSKVKPGRDTHRDARLKKYWWLHGRPRVEMRQALAGLTRYIATSQVSKHRVFAFADGRFLPDVTLVVIARDDDYTFGVLHSILHEVWALAVGTQLESRPRYTHTSCFETFPFPEPTDSQRTAIADAAARLNELREGWLNPAGASDADLKKRTLTNLYNQRPTWLANLHATLDAAVADAYGWPAGLADAEILERLLALNLQRAAQEQQ